MKIELHPDVLARRGRAEGYVNTQRRGTNIARVFEQPLNPQSDIQQDVRGSFGSAAAVWGTVSASQASAWNVFATNFTRINNVGVYVTLTGIEACVMVNTYRLMDGAAVTQDPPAYAPINDFVTLDALTIAATDGQWDLTIGEGAVPANSIALVRVTPVVDNPVYPSQDGDYRMPTLITEDSLIDIGSASGSLYTLSIASGDLRAPYTTIVATDAVRVHVRLLTNEYCPPSLPPNAYNVSGIVTITAS